MNEIVKKTEDLGQSNLPAQSTAPLLQMIERVMTMPEFDVTKLDQMLDLQERVLNRDAEMAFNQAMMLAQQQMPSIEKKARNDHTKSFYATLDEVNKKAVPIYTKNGFSVSFNTGESPMGEEFIRIIAYVSHVNGHTRDYNYDMPIDDKGTNGTKNKTNVHGRASSVSYGQRYLISIIFNLSAARDNDGNQDQPEVKAVSSATLSKITDLMAAAERTEEQCLQFLNTAAGREYASLKEIEEQHAFKLIGKLKEASK